MAVTLKIVQKFFPKVKAVVDATKPVTIKVTKDDAKSEGKNDHAACAMALACKRSFHLDGVIISRSTAYLIKGTKARRFMVGGSIGREITSFDRGSGFAPGIYHLSAVPESRRMGLHKGGPKDQTGKGTSPKYRHITTGIRTVLAGAEDGD